MAQVPFMFHHALWVMGCLLFFSSFSAELRRLIGLGFMSGYLLLMVFTK